MTCLPCMQDLECDGLDRCARDCPCPCHEPYDDDDEVSNDG